MSKDLAKNSLSPEPSNRNFGFLISTFLGAISIYSLYHSSSLIIAISSITACFLFFITSCLMPNTLEPAKRIWLRIGSIMGTIVSPLVIALIFFVLITPLALTIRIFGRDELRLKKKNIDSYWVARNSYALISDTFKNQF
jgi:hypothetical protein